MDLFLSIFLAKLIGVAFLIIGVFFIFKTKNLQSAMMDMGKSPALMTVVGIVRIFVGLAIIYGHNEWIFRWPVVITLLGYLILFNGILMLFLQKEIMAMILKAAPRVKFFKMMGAVILIVGIFLSYCGFWAV